MVSFKSIVIPVLVLVIFVAGGLAMYQVADLGQKSAAKDDGTLVENETHVQRIGFWLLTDNSTAQYTAGFNDTVSVYNSSDVELEEGTDYEWNSTDGAVLFKDTESTEDGQTYNITYTYFQNTEQVRELSGPLDVITIGTGHAAYLAAGLAMVVFLLILGGVIAKYHRVRGGPRTRR